MASISGSVTIAGDPDDWIAVAWDADTHAYAGVATVSGGAYEITGLTAGKAYVVGCRPRTGAIWTPENPNYIIGTYAIPTDPASTPYIFQATSSEPGDLYFDDVTLLLSMDGVNDGTTFTDAKSKTVTPTLVLTKTATKKYGSASAYFAGASPNYLTISADAGFLFDVSYWTIEFWFYWPSSITNTYPFLFDNRTSPLGTGLLVYGNDTDNKIYVTKKAIGTEVLAISSALTRDIWQHVSIVRNGSAVKFYVNGVGGGTEWSSPDSIGSSSNTLYIGDGYPAGRGAATRLGGYLDDYRITKGVARYTSNFQPPEAAHYAYAGLPSGAVEPTWPTTPGNTVVDGGVTWTNMGQLVRPLMHGPLVAI